MYKQTFLKNLTILYSIILDTSNDVVVALVQYVHLYYNNITI